MTILKTAARETRFTKTPNIEKLSFENTVIELTEPSLN